MARPGSRRSGMASATVAAPRSEAAITNRPPAKLPVSSRATPTSEGPTKPPMLPIELISARPAAAAGPVRMVIGSAQLGPSADQMPIAAPDRSTRPSSGESTSAQPITARPPIAAGTATCQRRSPVLSECFATGSMQIAASRYGTAETRPTARSPKPDRLRTICGSQNAMPYIAVTTRKYSRPSVQMRGLVRERPTLKCSWASVAARSRPRRPTSHARSAFGSHAASSGPSVK